MRLLGIPFMTQDIPPSPHHAGEAVAHRIITQELAQMLFLVVALSMALTPFLAELGQKVGKAFDSHDMKARHRRPRL